jgi:hypothetical protein
MRPRPSRWLGWTGKSSGGASWASIPNFAEPMQRRSGSIGAGFVLAMSVVLSLTNADLAFGATSLTQEAIEMQVPATSPDQAPPDLLGLVADLPVVVNVPDLAALATLDPATLAGHVRRALEGASPEAADRIRRSLAERRPDMEGGLPAVDVYIKNDVTEIWCEWEHLLSVPREQAV